MHNWQTHTPLRRSGILRSSSQVTDSINHSLRQFHLSSIAEEEISRRSTPNQSSTPRIARLRNASKEVQTLLPGVSLNEALRKRGPEPRSALSIIRTPATTPPPGQRPLIRMIGTDFDTNINTGRFGTSRGGAYQGSLEGSSSLFRGGGALHGRGGEGLSGRGALSRRGGGLIGRGALNGRGGFGSRGGRGNFGDRGRGRGRKRRNARQDNHSGDDGPMEFTAAEEIYMKEKAEREGPAPTPYQPDTTAEHLHKLGPAMFLGQRGMSEIFEEKLDKLAPAGLRDLGVRDAELVKEMLSGEFIRFKSDEELQSVIALADSKAKQYAETRSEEKGEVISSTPIEFETLNEDTRTRMITHWLKGEYALEDMHSKSAAIRHLRTATGRNGSYLPKDQDSIAAKVRGLLPAQRVPSTSASAPRPMAS